MNALLATILFLAALIIHATGAHVPVWLDWQSLMLAGFFCISLSATGQWFGDQRFPRHRN